MKHNNRWIGIENAKRMGKYSRSKLKFTPYSKNLRRAFAEYLHRKQNKMLVSEIAQTNGMTRRTLDRKLKRYNPADYVKQHPSSPFSKWAGGKRSLLHKFHQCLPDSFNPNHDRLYEPFCGMAALTFDIQPKRAILSDTNRDVIDCFKSVRDSPHELIRRIRRLVAKNSKATFNHQRFLLNNAEWPSSVARASAFLYLIRNSYAGFIRYNRIGKINISFNIQTSKRRQLHVKRILNDSYYLRNADIKLTNTDFANVLRKYPPSQDDFVFLDPPYAASRSLLYGAQGFSLADLARLYVTCLNLSERSVKWLMTDYDDPVVRRMFQQFKIEPLKQKVTRNHGAFRMRKLPEIIITDY